MKQNINRKIEGIKRFLLSKFLGSIQSPIANFARVIKQIAEKDGEASETAEA